MSNFIKNFPKSSKLTYSTRRAISNAVVQKNRTPPNSKELLKPVEFDMIGTPDPISNLRPVKYYIPPEETKEERDWRESCQRVDEFNQKFWHENNLMFAKAKDEYEKQLQRNGQEITPEALSMFYKNFLNKAYDRQMQYNRAWWKMNIAQLYPGLKACIRHIKKSKKNRELNQGTGFWEKSFES